MTVSPNEPWTVLRLINWTKDYFAKSGVCEGRLAAEVLLAHVLSCRRIELYTRFDYQPTKQQLETYRGLVQRAKANEPIAYLVGTKEFYSLTFKVTADVLIPRPETEILVTEAVGHLKSLGRPGRMWDACTGSGCVAIATAVNVPDAAVLATDISGPALAVAGENAALNKVDSRIRLRHADLLNLPPDCGDMGQFDVITANPPYIAQGQEIAEPVKHEPGVALWAGQAGLDMIEPIIAAAPDLLAADGMLAIEFGYGQADQVRELVVGTGRLAEPRILRDHQGIERAAVTIRR